MWLLLGSLIGTLCGCAIAYAVDVVERLLRNRRAAIRPAAGSGLDQWTVEK